MPPTHKPFDPSQQFDSLMTELESVMIDAGAKIARLAFLREKIAAEHAALQAAVDALECYTEEEAAAQLKTTARMLKDLRSRHRLPHFLVGREVRYTGEQLREIVAILELNGKSRKAQQATPLKLAA